MELADVRGGLEAFIHDECGSTARLDQLAESDGHAGLTFLFDVAQTSGVRQGYVIKLPPSGVKRSGNTDVYRQAPLLRALKQAGHPVPEVPWACDDNRWFDVPFIIMERLPGRTFFVWDPMPELAATPADCTRYWEQCTTWLARLHAFDWQRHLPTWEAPASLASEISRWDRIFAKAPEPAWIAAAEATQAAVLDTLPDGQPVGLFHGDYQPGNCLYDGEDFVGIIDWELSGIGAQLLDIGWLLMVADSANWAPQWQPHHPIPATRIREIYAAEGGRDDDMIPWYQALAGYRLGCITCLNVRLHRQGQRHDPMWEMNGLSVMSMFRRAQELVAPLR